MKRFAPLVGLCIFFQPVFAQQNRDAVNKDAVFNSSIKTIEFYNRRDPMSMPVYTLGSGDELVLAFDDLRSGTRNLSYTLEHCDAEWNTSRLSSMEYLQGFTEGRITDYRFSVNTLQKYTHYELSFPNTDLKPRISGNYLIRVFENNERDRPLFTRRLYVVNAQAAVSGEVTVSNDVSKRDRNQKLNLLVNFPFTIQNPFLDIKVRVLQNGRESLAQMAGRPSFIRQNQFTYNDLRLLDFAGGNEFRRFDTRTYRFRSEHVALISRDTLYRVSLFPDRPVADRYLTAYDQNGSFTTRNNEGRTYSIDADYSPVSFALDAPAPDENGSPYVVGKFNNYRLDASSQMLKVSEGKYVNTQLIKQGITDYHYVWADPSGKLVNETAFDGSFFQALNQYQVFVYYRKPGGRTDELIGFVQLDSAGNRR